MFYGLEQSLLLLKKTGLGKIEGYLEDLTNELCDQLASRRYDIVSSRLPGERSAIVCIRHRNGQDCNILADQLLSENVVVSPRNDILRIAPHFYNNSEDIKRLLSALP